METGLACCCALGTPEAAATALDNFSVRDDPGRGGVSEDASAAASFCWRNGVI